MISPRPSRAHVQSHDEAAGLLDGPSPPGLDAGPVGPGPAGYLSSIVF